MSVHSIDHIDDEVSDRAYKGYRIDNAGEVTEFYDHRDDGAAESSAPASSYRQPLVASNGHSQHTPSERPAPQRKRRVKHKDAGCCNGCVSLLTTIGNMPFATGFALLGSWLGTGLFIGGAWKAMDETLNLFSIYGPNDGNPATDPAPQYVQTGVGGTFSNNYVLLNQNDLGNRVPEVFQSLQYSFYALIPFMLLFTIIIACDNRHVSRSLLSKKKSCKTGSTGICFTAGLIVFTYIVILLWVFFLAFTTLGVYYYRVVMLRCHDMNDRDFSPGVLSSICIDLVQFGLIMFQNTNDEGFGKICGPGDNRIRSYGRLEDYCKAYYPVYEHMLMAFSGCLLNIIAMVNFIMILSVNYSSLTKRLNSKSQTTAPASTYYPTSTAAPTTYRESPALLRSGPSSAITAPPAYVTGTRDREYPSDGEYRARRSSRDIDSDYRARRSSRDLDADYRARRSSKDIELDYVLDSASSAAPRYREADSNVGVNYYYKDRR